MLKKREKSLFLSPAPLIWYSPPQTLYDIEANVQEEEWDWSSGEDGGLEGVERGTSRREVARTRAL